MLKGPNSCGLIFPQHQIGISSKLSQRRFLTNTICRNSQLFPKVESFKLAAPENLSDMVFLVEMIKNWRDPCDYARRGDYCNNRATQQRMLTNLSPQEKSNAIVPKKRKKCTLHLENKCCWQTQTQVVTMTKLSKKRFPAEKSINGSSQWVVGGIWVMLLVFYY